MNDRMNDRMISTGMSAKIISNLVKRGWSVRRIAKAIDATAAFIEGVQTKRHVLTVNDIKALAQQSGQSFNMMIMESFTITPENRRFIESGMNLIRLHESPGPSSSRGASRRKRRVKSKAA